MLSQFIQTALIIGPIVWLFFALYFHAKKHECRRILLGGMLYGTGVGSLFTFAALLGQWSIF